MADDSRIAELRRRVQEDPASIAFAPLAEEYRRAGATDEAISVCRAGLQYHPDYLSARVTLARALIELDRHDEAEVELNTVLKTAHDNLPATRALAEVFQRRGQLARALAYYRKALDLAKFDPDIAHEVERIETAVSPPPPPVPESTARAAVADLFDFDALLEQLGGRTQRSLQFDARTPAVPAAPSPLDAVTLRADDADPFSVLERQLRDTPPQPYSEPHSEEQPEATQQVLAELEAWLTAISIDRRTRPNA
ncbi:MAG TPA: tetratricopeptide repeat protein [Vicinamibacterales bacterium]|nr:tetratricopeptide repeat protein [Vicinamibacterales bacterium]